MTSVFLEVVFDSEELNSHGIESRDELEDAIQDALVADGLGEVTGGGSGAGVAVVDVELFDEGALDSAISVIRREMKAIGAPRSTVIKRYLPSPATYQIFE